MIVESRWPVMVCRLASSRHAAKGLPAISPSRPMTVSDCTGKRISPPMTSGTTSCRTRLGRSPNPRDGDRRDSRSPAILASFTQPLRGLGFFLGPVRAKHSRGVERVTGLVAVISGAALGYFADQLPELSSCTWASSA